MAEAPPDSLWRTTLRHAVEAPPLERAVRADLVIIGGGFSGNSAALTAATLGLEVRLLEARATGHGGSGRNVGLVNAGLWLPPEAIAARLGNAAAGRLNASLASGPERVFALIEAHGIDCEATRAGTLHLAHSARGLRELEDRRRQLRALGAPVELLDAAATAARTGSEAFPGALFDPRAGTIQPLAYCHGLAAAARAAGASLHENTPALSIARDGPRWSVRTPRGRVDATALLLATNAYHVEAAGVAAPVAAPLYYFQFATDPLPSTAGAAILPGGEGCWDTAAIMTSFRRDAAGRLIVGSVGSLDHPGRQIHRKWVKRRLATLFPALGAAPLRHAWCGRIAMTVDHLPKILRLGERALSLFGYSGRGIAPATLFGDAAARALASGDFSVLPLAPIEHYSEPWRRARQACYESGAAAFHLLHG